MRAFFVRNLGAKPNVTREKLPKRRSYKKCARKTFDEIDTRLEDIGTAKNIKGPESKLFFHLV